MQYENTEIAKYLLEKGVPTKVYDNDNSPLISSIMLHDLDITEELLKHGISPNIPITTDTQKLYPLELVLQNNLTDFVYLLLSFGANPHLIAQNYQEKLKDYCVTEKQAKSDHKSEIQEISQEIHPIDENSPLLFEEMMDSQGVSPAEIMSTIDRIREFYYEVSKILPKFSKIYSEIYNEYKPIIEKQAKIYDDSKGIQVNEDGIKHLAENTEKEWKENRLKLIEYYELLDEVNEYSFPFFANFVNFHELSEDYLYNCINDLTEMYNSAVPAVTMPELLDRISIPHKAQEVLQRTLKPKLDIVLQTVEKCQELKDNSDIFGDLIIWRFLSDKF